MDCLPLLFPSSCRARPISSLVLLIRRSLCVNIYFTSIRNSYSLASSFPQFGIGLAMLYECIYETTHDDRMIEMLMVVVFHRCESPMYVVWYEKLAT